MKSKEEIEGLAIKHAHLKPNFDRVEEEYYNIGAINAYESFIKGYTQCQEDTVKELHKFGKLVLDTFHSEGKTHSGKDRLARIKFDEWFNSLNKQD